MTTDTKQFLEKQHAEFLAFNHTLHRETDRGCALFAAAYLDKALSDLLYLSLVLDKKIEEELFEGTAPLATFSARIKLAYYLGKISVQCRRDLDTIRGIRNEFAHKADLLSFEDQSLAARCRNLKFSYHERTTRPRAHFTAAVARLLATIQAAALAATAPIVMGDDTPTEDEKRDVRKQIETLGKEIDTELKKQAEAEWQAVAKQKAKPDKAP
jgi:DNA-binding MltR family transcriptional regulator